MGDDMSVENKEQEHIEDVTDNHIDVDKSKRKFSKAASITAPVIMAFASRPSWVQAADASCSFRQALSGNTSQVGAPQCTDGRASTVSPGVFRGDGGGDGYEDGGKWEQFGVGGLRDFPFSTIFGISPNMDLKEQYTTTIGGVAPEIPGPEGVTTLERALKAIKKDFENGDAFKENKDLFNQVFHYIGGYLMASSKSTPIGEDPLMRPLVYPYTPEQIAADWGVWDLYATLQKIQDVHFTVAMTNVYVGITL